MNFDKESKSEGFFLEGWGCGRRWRSEEGVSSVGKKVFLIYIHI